jgi:hypothetical protein
VPDIDQTHHPVHCLRVVDLECVVQGEGVHVDDVRLETHVSEQRDLVIHQLALGRDQEHRHLEPLAIRVQDLEVELDVVHVERDVLLRLPADDFACLGLLHAVHRDLLHDHIAAADGGHHRSGLDAGLGHEAPDGLGHDAGVHDLALDDRVVADRREGHLGQNRATGGVRYGDELDQAATDIQADSRRLAPEESHTVSAG